MTTTKRARLNPAKVTADLRPLGIPAARLTRRVRRSGLEVRKVGPTGVSVSVADYGDELDREDTFERVIERLEATGYRFAMLDGSRGADALEKGRRAGIIIVYRITT